MLFQGNYSLSLNRTDYKAIRQVLPEENALIAEAGGRA